MTILTLIGLGLLVSGLLLWRELRRAPLLAPGYDADGQPLSLTIADHDGTITIRPLAQTGHSPEHQLTARN